MRDLMLLAALVMLVPLALKDSFVAYLLWGWTAVISVDSYVFGFMQDVRLNLIFAVITIGMIVLRNGRERRVPVASRTVALLLAFLVHGTLAAAFAYDGNPLNWDLYEKFVKTLLFALLMPLVMTGRYRIHAFIVVLCLGLGFHGIIDGLKFVASGGGHIVRGFAKFGDNNHFAVVLVMVIPLLLYLSNHSKARLVRFAALGGALTTTAAVIGTHSRGGFVSLVAMGLWLVLTSRRRLASSLVFAAGVALVLAFAPSSWTERMETIQSAEKDSSFMSRVEAWQVSSAIALDNPVFGGGFHAVQVQSIWDQFRGRTGLLGFVNTGLSSQIFRAAHSIYFEVMGDLGFVGFIFFAAIMINAVLTGSQLRRLAASHEEQWGWAADLSRALTAVIVAFLVGGASVSLAYSEVIYMVVMLQEILKREIVCFINADSANPGLDGSRPAVAIP